MQQSVRLLFATSHYRWAKARYAVEVCEGFPLIRQFSDAGAKAFLEMISEMSQEHQHRLGQALMRRYHIDAVAQLNELSDAEEQILVEKYIHQIRSGLGYPNRYAAPTVGNSIPKRQRPRKFFSVNSLSLKLRVGFGLPC